MQFANVMLSECDKFRPNPRRFEMVADEVTSRVLRSGERDATAGIHDAVFAHRLTLFGCELLAVGTLSNIRLSRSGWWGRLRPR